MLTAAWLVMEWWDASKAKDLLKDWLNRKLF